MMQASNGAEYNTEKATLLGRDSPDSFSRNRYLYRTDKGAFFLYRVHETPSIGVILGIEATPLDVGEAVEVYNTLEERCVDFSEAFPDIAFKEA